MKILQIAASAARSDGGPTTGVIGLNRAYNRLPGSSSIAIVTDADGYRGRLCGEERAALSQEGLRLIVTSRSFPYRLKNSWRLVNEVWRTTPHVDVLHVHGVYLAHTVWAYLAARRWKRPYVIQPHGCLEPYQAEQGRLKKRLWDVVIGRRILAHATALIAASDAERDNLLALLPTATIIVTPLGVPEVEPSPTPQVLAELDHWLSAPRSRRVLFLGRLARKKRPDVLFDAWNELDVEATLAVVGPEDAWTHDQLSRRLAPGRRDSVTFVETVDPSGVAWFMREAAIFVLPSESENFGITIAEAMAGGCAVVTTRFAAASDHVTAADAGVVLDTVDVDDVARTLRQLIADPRRVNELGCRGIGYAAQHLTWEAAGRTILCGLMQSTNRKPVRDERHLAPQLRATSTAPSEGQL